MSESLFSSPLTLIACSVLVTLTPIIFLLVSPFLKLSIVFGVLRTGFGTQGIPGTAALSALSLILSFHVLSPVIVETGIAIDELLKQRSKSSSAKDILTTISSHAKNILSPVEGFLEQHTGKKERAFFEKSGSSQKLLELIPAFVLTELKTAFEMALYLFLPFLIIDLVVTSLLTAMGMMMINPVNLTFPLKLILFVNCDGWLEITKSLVASY